MPKRAQEAPTMYRTAPAACRFVPRPGFKPILEVLEDRVAPTVEVTPHGGSIGISSPVLVNAQVATVFYGSAWTSNQSLYQDSQAMNEYFNFITKSSYMDLMRQYYETAFPAGRVSVGRGSWTGYDYTVAQPGNVVNDAQIHQMLISELGNGRLPVDPNNYYDLYFVFLPPGVTDEECLQNNWGPTIVPLTCPSVQTILSRLRMRLSSGPTPVIRLIRRTPSSGRRFTPRMRWRRR
jgi:hypothetical protein